MQVNPASRPIMAGFAVFEVGLMQGVSELAGENNSKGNSRFPAGMTDRT